MTTSADLPGNESANTSGDKSGNKFENAKICPRCGKTHIVVWSAFNGGFYAMCQGCHAETPTAPSELEALNLWNQGVFE